MKRLHVLVEGQTEDVFVRDVLTPHLTGKGGAEQMNDDPTTPPSKRLAKVFPSYQKTLHGPIAVGAIGLAAVRAACPHADQWLKRLEAL